jgi:hypothetical protein
MSTVLDIDKQSEAFQLFCELEYMRSAMNQRIPESITKAIFAGET